MTVPAAERKAGPFNGNGSTTEFPFEFKVFTTADIEVVYADVDGIETVLELDSDYSVSLNADQDATPGGTVTYPISGTALATGEKLSVAGALAYEQETDIPTGGNFNPTVLENALDKLSMQTQQLAEAISRAAKVPITNAADADTLTQAILVAADNITGLQTIVANINDIQTVADDLNEATSEIEVVAGAITNVNAVGNNITNVGTVAGISSNVTTVAGISSNVTSVAAISSAVSGVAAISSAVSAVNSNATNINAVNANKTNIDTAATNIAAIIDAPSQASAAAASAAAAAASAASGMFSAVQDKSANYTIVVGDAGDLIRVNTSGGARTITLPAISTVTDGFKIAVVKWTSDGNAVTVARSGSDTINGATSYSLGNQYSAATFVADAETAQWFALGSGLGVSNVTVDPFSGNGSSTAFTLSGDPGSENNTQVFVGGVYQEKDTYSVSGTTLTFSTAPPSGTSNIEVVWTVPLAIGTPSDGSVTTAKIADANVTAAKMASGAAAGNLGFTPVNKAGDLMTGSLGTKALLETATITAAAPSSTTHFDVNTQAVQYYTTNAANNFTLNLRASSGASLDSIMAVGQSVTVALMVTNGATPYYMSALTIDGSAVTPKWQGGSAPTSGNASSIDTYGVTVVKTATATFTAFASQTQFK